MANIRVNLSGPPVNGQTVTFRSPSSGTEVAGLITYYPNGSTTSSKVFQFADAHGNNVGGKNLFSSNVLVKVILDTELSRAYVQNADTNSYLENKFKSHSQPASTITAGTLAGKVVANASAVTDLTAKQVRNIYAGTADMTAGVTELATGDIYIVYE